MSDMAMLADDNGYNWIFGHSLTVHTIHQRELGVTFHDNLLHMLSRLQLRTFFQRLLVRKSGNNHLNFIQYDDNNNNNKQIKSKMP
ncbi:hypothetical protein DERF_004192 [Dermatophagoides farinae]|uniref:Uncharacterized protein n=1 Tax=Dermatophagoides farinae TaxID=6954 RepID=A0A922I1X3_DERFA|nr:hypothetical protein DERF_004192 [Dermatophagoides farinae]